VTQEQFLRVHGVGRRKLEAYFEPVVAEIRAYCAEHALPVGLEPPAEQRETRPRNPVPAREPHQPTHAVTLALYRQGLSVEEVANERGLAVGTIVSHLITQLELGEQLDLTPLVPPERYQAIVDALLEVGDERLKPVKDFLGEAYSYEEIRLVRALERRAAREEEAS
jgi:ATP-dependent DNA helicase RecQ